MGNLSERYYVRNNLGFLLHMPHEALIEGIEFSRPPDQARRQKCYLPLAICVAWLLFKSFVYRGLPANLCIVFPNIQQTRWTTSLGQH